MTIEQKSRSVAAVLIGEILSATGTDAELLSAHEREWASMTFSGARHCISMRIPVPDANALPPLALVRLGDHDFDLTGQIVADCSVTFGSANRDAGGQLWLPCTVELLTVTAD